MLKILFVGYITEVIVMSLSFLILGIIIKKPIAKEKNRQRIVNCYMFFYKLSLFIISGGLLVFQLAVLVWLYKYNYYFVKIISNSKELASYFALTVSLISSVPITLFIFKFVKRKQYIDSKNGQDKFANIDNSGVMQSIYYTFINKIIDMVNDFPFMGIIHIINMILVIGANIIKALNINTELTTTSIYMGIATFYSVDKVIDYFKKKYPAFWKKLDNKIFFTEEINNKIVFGYKDMFNIVGQIFKKYISTGKYDISNIIGAEEQQEKEQSPEKRTTND